MRRKWRQSAGANAEHEHAPCLQLRFLVRNRLRAAGAPANSDFMCFSRVAFSGFELVLNNTSYTAGFGWAYRRACRFWAYRRACQGRATTTWSTSCASLPRQPSEMRSRKPWRVGRRELRTRPRRWRKKPWRVKRSSHDDASAKTMCILSRKGYDDDCSQNIGDHTICASTHDDEYDKVAIMIDSGASGTAASPERLSGYARTATTTTCR